MKSKSTATLLALFLGGLGFHQFYLGRTKRGVLYQIFFWTMIPIVFGFYDSLLYRLMSADDFNMRYNGVV